MFDYYEVPYNKKVKLASTHLKGKASEWWKQLQKFRQRNGNEKIREWNKMKMKLEGKFLLFNHMQIGYEIVNEHCKEQEIQVPFDK